MPASEPLHVTNGWSVVGTLRATALGGSLLGWNDSLHEGPVPAVPEAQLRDVRARFLSECGWESRTEILKQFERRHRLLAQALEKRQQVVLWFEHDLYDQLQLLQILNLVGESGTPLDRLELIEIDTFEGMPDFHGLGELDPEQLESLWPMRRPVTGDRVRLALLAWEAFREPEPTAIERFLAVETGPLPFLASAFRRLLEQLPDECGLSRSERQLLEALAERQRTPIELFFENECREEAPFEGVEWVWRRLWDLGAGEYPLVVLASGEAVPNPLPLQDHPEFRTATLMLTEAGRAVLDGKADAIELNGIDRWLGGVHLRPDSLWRWDRARGRIA